MTITEYIDGMAGIIRTTGADVRIEDIDGRKRIAAKFHSVNVLNSEMKKAFIANAETLKALNAGLKALRASGEIKAATNGYAPTLLEGGVEFRMDFVF